jgi:RNA polymerase sigma-54 factor
VVPRVGLNRVYAELFQQHRNAKHAELAAHLQEARWTCATSSSASRPS